MELGSRVRWIVVSAVFIIVLILVGWGLFSIASNIFRNNGEDTSQLEPVNDFLVESTAVARYTLDGPVVANDKHRSYTIEVSKNVVSMKVYKSFGQVLIAEKSYTNTSLAYDAFLSALENANVTALAKNASTEVNFTDQGVCARGKKFIVELDSSVRRWSTSCGKKEGNAGFPMAPVGSLFQSQVPDFRDLTKGLGI